ncbi:unnamed protein product [Phytophthora fragariaefolia]|uniref:Unnamed protein product n=1 Tax=Phytophthora fragariaefolia TaxID=1490495 RepID=A0A9W6YAZ9_9STRA|nr:unnamed protein product [Phytophthora fragariaefolia]
MMSLRSLALIRRRIKDAITTSDSFMSSDGTGIRSLTVAVECPSGRHSAGYRERVRLARERYERFSKRPKIDRLHWGAVEAGISWTVPMGIACEHCHIGAVRETERDINGYTSVRVPEELKALRTNLIAQMSSSAAGGRSTLSRAVGDSSSRSSFAPFGGFGGDGLRTPSPFPERPASGRSAAPTYRGSEEIPSNEYENNQDLGSGSDDQQFAGRSSELPPVRLAVGWRRREDAAGVVHQTPLIVWRLLNASRRRTLDGMSNVYALPCFANMVKGPMKRGASKLAPKSDTTCLARFGVASETNEPILNSLVLPLSLLAAFSFRRSTEAAIPACRRWTKFTAFELNPMFSSASLFTTGPACVCVACCGLECLRSASTLRSC